MLGQFPWSSPGATFLKVSLPARSSLCRVSSLSLLLQSSLAQTSPIRPHLCGAVLRMMSEVDLSRAWRPGWIFDLLHCTSHIAQQHQQLSWSWKTWARGMFCDILPTRCAAGSALRSPWIICIVSCGVCGMSYKLSCLATWGRVAQPKSVRAVEAC